MRFQFTHPAWLWLLIPVLAWTLWLAINSHASLSGWRRWTSAIIRLVLLLLLLLGIAGLQWKQLQEGMNVFFLLDRSDSIPSGQQEEARELANSWAKNKREKDLAGFLIFGSDAALETTATEIAEAEKIQAVVGTERTDIAGAIRLATAAFGEEGQKRIVLFTDGNENMGDAYSALLAAKPQGVSLDAFPLGVSRGGDVSVQRISLPASLKRGQTFDAKIFVNSDRAQPATVRLYRNDQLLGQQRVQLETGKNLFTFPQTLEEPDFYRYSVQVDVAGDTVAQNNRANGFTTVRGNPRILIVSADTQQDQNLLRALQDRKLEIRLTDLSGFPSNLSEMQSYDAIFLSNISAGDLGREFMQLLESAVRDFGVGLVCIGGDNSYAAGGYRSTPLETTLPVDMELSSKKVLPSGALALVMHGMEFNNGNQIAREIAIASLDALGPQDEMGVLLWDGSNRWLFELQKVADKKVLAAQIAGMNQGDLPDFQGLMSMGYEGLRKSPANLKHMIVFSDGDPGPPQDDLMDNIVGAKITVSTIMIGGHVQPTTMIRIAERGRGRFYDVQSPAQLPQIFIKEAAVILKSAIFEEPFQPQVAAPSELIRGIGSGEFPRLRGYVAATAKPRAETPLVSEKGDPILAHWQYGLGRAVAFTSDAKPKWAIEWMGWDKYRQFWSQVANWAMRRIETAQFNADVTIDAGQGLIHVEALDAEGNFRNFLNLQTTVVSPRGERVSVSLEQSGPGRYEARFPTKEVGAYLLNLAEIQNGQPVASQAIGASVNYSPEFNATEPNLNLIQRLAELGEGKVLEEGQNPFQLNRKKTYRPQDCWEGLLRAMILLFVLDVGVRRVDIDREEWGKWWERLKIRIGFGNRQRALETQESLGALLARRDQVRSTTTGVGEQPSVAREELFKPREVPSSQRPPPAGRSAGADSAAAGADSKETSETPETPTSTASRLLEAKRRAKKK